VDFTIRNLPAPVLDELKRAARRNRRSVNEEAISRLAGKPLPECRDLAAEMARIDRLRASLSVPPLTQEHLEQAIEEGRP
jgi:plasmid stability protein